MDPPMYIFCDKEAVFDHNKYASYTKAGTEISYVVWPVLYLYKNGPLVRKGVAQGQKRDSKVKASGPLLPELDHLQDYETGVQGETKRDSDEQAKLTKRAEEMRSKDNVGLKTNVSHVSGFESNRDDPGTNQDTEEGMHQTTPKVVDSMLVQPTLECKDIENTSVDDYKELWQKDTAMSDLELMQINVVINEMEQTDNNLNVLDGY
ncbi:hypothetical protein CHS0354_026305 [Potamilus streckersoni]|uniref:Mitochondria-eating protein C-terminal domain-containing protein n=1 Tax=Potamilus streckersoni TaxID=2493646 RepID=A0AAE0TBQ8_9BIVA|nr:hypothetical protein CHS0354_026305 [Potamilus streckersoni]